MAFLMLFSVMWTVIDAFTRIVADILYVNSRVGPFKRYLTWLQRISIHKLYYGAIVAIVLVSAFLVPLRQPLILLTISAVLGGITMAVYTPIIIYLNNAKLPKPLRPGWFTNLAMVGVAIFYAYFSVALAISYLK